MTIQYRLALDLGSTSIGWAMIRLNAHSDPIAVIKAGVRIFSDGRNPKDGSSLAVKRREARAMRRRRDRLLKRKARMMHTLVKFGFFPKDEAARKALELLNPYELRAKGLDQALKPEEFARALFHINQRRGFQSNRKTDKKENDAGALKTAIASLRAQLGDKTRTVGEWLYQRHLAGQGVRARYRQTRVEKEDGKTRIDKSYDLYVDRAMIKAEFDALWKKQSELNPAQYTEQARKELDDCLFFQRPLKPVQPGRCTLIPEEPRAPLALPSQQRFRIYQEINHLRVLHDDLRDAPLTKTQRDLLADALEKNGKRTFTQIKKLLGFPGATQFNLEDVKREELKGNTTAAALSKADLFGKAWFDFSEGKQDEIVMQLLSEENEAALILWLVQNTGVDEQQAEAIATVGLAEGYGSLSKAALDKIIPALRSDVMTYDKAVLLAGFEHHSALRPNSPVQGRTQTLERIDQETGEVKTFHVWNELPYYGEALQRHVGFADPKATEDSPPEKRFGKIANPTVHIGLNQVRTIVNALIKRYGHPAEVIVELARDLKQTREQKLEDQKRQAENQKRNQRYREEIAKVLNCSEAKVKQSDIQKMILWYELSFDAADRKCPYSGEPISVTMLLSNQVEIEHIFPFSKTLDDSLNNKTVATVKANRIKGNRSPWEARADFDAQGWSYEGIQHRAERMPKAKRYRFAPDGYEQWLREDKTFLARALNDTRHLSRVAREYVSLICPQATRVIPGQMTALLRAKFGLNDILGLEGEKNRNDHRHHAVDACVIGVTDQGLLQRFAQASASTRAKAMDKLVDEMPLPWATYREHVARAVSHIWVSHKPDHGHEAGMMDETTYRPPHLDAKGQWRTRGIGGNNPNERDAQAPMIAIRGRLPNRHHVDHTGRYLPYKGYVGGSNYCIEITRDSKGKWQGEVISTFRAYEIERNTGLQRLQNPSVGQNEKPLLMRLVSGDAVRLVRNGITLLLRVAKMRDGRNQVTLVGNTDANHADRAKNKDQTLTLLQDVSANQLFAMRARPVSISPIGELRDPGFRE